MCVAIKAIDSAQLPMELALVGVLKKAVKIRFKLLTSGIKLATNDWTLPLLKVKLREWESGRSRTRSQHRKLWRKPKPTLRQPGEEGRQIHSRIETSRANRAKEKAAQTQTLNVLIVIRKTTNNRIAGLRSEKEMIAAAENEVEIHLLLALVVTNLEATAAVPAATMTRRPVKIIRSKFTKRSNFH